MKKLFQNRFLLFFAASLLFLASCRKDSDLQSELRNVNTFSSEVPLQWNELFLEIERYADGYRPGPAPRALAYMGLAGYEALVQGMPEYRPLSGLYNGLTIPSLEANSEYHWPLVLNAVYGSMMPRFFSHMDQHFRNEIVRLEKSFEDEFASVNQQVFNRSVQYGKAVGDAVWAWSLTDPVGHNAFTDPFGNFQLPVGPGLWKPTFPGPGRPMFPYWGQARRFAISESDRLCPAPIPYSEDPLSQYYTQALEVYSISNPLSYVNRWIGEFWSDDLVNVTFSPGPRFLAIANQVIEKENATLDIAVVTNAKIGMALNDAAVACWHSKYVYNIQRPVDFIREVIDPTWVTALNHPLTGDQSMTPSFPAYPSGHSTMGAAGSEILASIFGTSYVLTDRCHEHRSEFLGTPRTFYSFYEMAEENAFSRIPLGVHFRMDCEEGVKLGYRCARKVNSLPWKR